MEQTFQTFDALRLFIRVSNFYTPSLSPVKFHLINMMTMFHLGFMQLGHYLVHFMDLVSLMQGLIATRERVDQLKYLLEQVKAINAELMT